MTALARALTPSIFTHTCPEPGMWRGWLKDGQTLEMTWGRRARSCVGLGILLHGSEVTGKANRMIWIGLGFFQAFIPTGIVDCDDGFGDEPSWKFDLSREFGIVLHWNRIYKSWQWPLHRILIERCYQAKDGGWIDIDKRWKEHFNREPAKDEPAGSDQQAIDPTSEPKQVKHWDHREGAYRVDFPYVYTLESGEVQNRTATVIKERWIHGRHLLDKIGWPRETVYHIDVEFDDEVGERTGSWKGGVVGTGQTMIPGETVEMCLRRMERERKF